MPRKPKAEFEISAVDRATRVLLGIEGRLGGVGSAARGLGLTLAGAIGARSVTDVVRVTDEYTRLQNRVEFLTRETGNFNAVYSKLFDTAIETGGELETSINTFQSLDRVRGELGLTDAKIVQLNQNLQRLGAIGQTSTQEQSNGLRQLNQAFAGGIVRAEEFNSVLENTPEVAAAIAKGLDLSVGQLRRMVVDGKLLASDVVEVLLAQTDDIGERFQAIPNNLNRAFSALETSIGDALADLDEATGFTAAIAERVQQIADEIRADNRPSVIQQLEAEAAILEVRMNDISALLARINSDNGFTSFVAGLGEDVGELNAELKKLGDRAFEVQVLLDGARDGAANPRQTPDPDPPAPPKTDAQIRAEAAEQARQARERAQRVEFAAEIARLEFEARDNAERDLHEFDLLRIAGFEDEKAQIDAIRRDELFQAKLERRQIEMEEELALELGFASARDQQLEEMESAHQEALSKARNKGNALAQKASAFQRKFEEANAQGKTQVLLGLAQDLTAGLATQSETAFKINKAASLAESIINTATGVTKALSVYDFVGAAIIAATGAAQIATISSTQFGGGTSGNTNFGAGTGIPSQAAESPLRGIPVVEQEERNTSRIELVVRGEGILGEAIAASLETEINDGDVLLITDRSRQALELDGRI